MPVATRMAPTCGGPSYVQTVSFMAAAGPGALRPPDPPRILEGRWKPGPRAHGEGAAPQRAREQAGEVARLLVEMDRREDEFDGPFRGHALGLERVGEAEAADREVGAGGAGAVELAVDVLAFRDDRTFRQEVEVGAVERLVEEGGADLDGLHAAFAGEEARERDLELAVGEEEDGLAAEFARLRLDRLAGAGAGGGGDGLEPVGRHAEFGCDGGEPGGRAFLAEGEGGGMWRAPRR
jgi:hypothetical protein